MRMTLRNAAGASLIAALMVVTGCSSDSPTAPTGNTGGGSGSGTTPPVGASINLTVSNPSPIVASTSTITATVTQNNTAVPNGTAVEFSTDFGQFTDTAAATTIRTTAGGTAAATLTASSAGTATVTVRVNNVVKTTVITFRVQAPGPDNSPTISGVSPLTSRPAGGGLVTITGSNFNGPVRVLFGTQEATVASVTSNQIQVIAPPISLGATEQSRTVTITVITQAGTASERSTTAAQSFRYEIEILTPVIYAVSPSSGPNEGSTRITIIGEGFQAPVKVYFGTSGGPGPLENQLELDVQQITFNQIIALTPPALGLGTDLRDKQVTLRVQNVNSNKDGVLASAFRYGPKMFITAVTPLSGAPGSKITINGWGFDDPVAVTVGDLAATPIKVSGTEIVAILGTPSTCGNASGPVTVRNIEDGAFFVTPYSVTILVPASRIVGVLSPVASGGTGTVTILNPGVGLPTITLGGETAFITASSPNSDGSVTYSYTVPSTLTFQTQTCSAGGTAPSPTRFPLVFTSGQNCTATINVIVNPPANPRLSVSPSTISMTTTVGTAASSLFNIINTGSGPVTVSSVNQLSGQACGIVGNGGAPFTADLASACDSTAYPISYNPAAAGSCSATFEVTSNTGQKLQVTVTATATAPAGP